VLAVCATLAPTSSVKPTDLALIKLDRATAVDISPDVVWIMAVGSDARPGEDMTHTRGDALQLIGINTKTGAAAAIGIPRDSRAWAATGSTQRSTTAGRSCWARRSVS
jgi:polyisoprenyl-teichoic acid--peptidoglycan teichoic acid transferase